MKPADDIRKFFQSAGLSTRPEVHERIFADVLRAHQRMMASTPAPPEIGRRIMRHPVTRYSIAAVLVLAATIGFTMFRHTGNVAWALEQSMEAMSKYTALLIEGSACERAWAEDGSLEQRPFRVWGVANVDQTKVEKYRFEFDGVTMLTTDGHKTWKYEPQAHRVTIKNRPYAFSECWLGSGLLEQLKQLRAAGTITYWQESSGKDPVTGKPVVVLNVAWQDGRWNEPQSVRLEFDLASKLLVSMRQWENANWEGSPSFIWEKITYYESLPDEVFEFEIRPGATVIEQ